MILGKACTRHTLFYLINPYSPLQILHFSFFFLHIEGLWELSLKQVYWYHIPSSICHFLFLCHILIIAVFQTFSLSFCHGNLWSVITFKLRYILFTCPGKPKISYDSLYCSICLILVVWNQTQNISEVCLTIFIPQFRLPRWLSW